MKEMISTRAAYGKTLKKCGAENKDIVVLDADLSCCTMTNDFAEAYPDRFYNVGIAECNMVGIAAGMAACGKIPFVNSFAMFTAGRAYDQIRNSVCYPKLNVKITGSHGGLSIGEDGATHQCIEDFALMRVIPGMTVVCPCDAYETEQAVKAIEEYNGPVYMRTGRLAIENVTPGIKDYHFKLGKGVQLKNGKDAAIIAAGMMVQEALKAADTLEKEGISVRVIDMHTIKPLDTDIIKKAADDTGFIVTTEEHNVIGGLGSAVCEFLSEYQNVRVVKHGVMDTFGRSGKALDVLKAYGLTADDIAETVRENINIGKNEQ